MYISIFIFIYMAMSFLLANKSLITKNPTEKSLPELCCFNKLINQIN